MIFKPQVIVLDSKSIRTGTDGTIRAIFVGSATLRGNYQTDSSGFATAEIRLTDEEYAGLWKIIDSASTRYKKDFVKEAVLEVID